MMNSEEELLIKELEEVVLKSDSIERDMYYVSDPALASQLISKAKSIIVTFDGKDSRFIKDIEFLRNKYDTLRYTIFLEIKGIIMGFLDLCKKNLITKEKHIGFSLKYNKILEEIEFSDSAYIEVINEINNTYKFGFFTSMYILIRKLLENLIYDCLKKYYGMKDKDKFFNESNGQHHGLSTLRLNFNNLIKEKNFKALVGTVDQKFIDLLKRI